VAPALFDTSPQHARRTKERSELFAPGPAAGVFERRVAGFQVQANSPGVQSLRPILPDYAGGLGNSYRPFSSIPVQGLPDIVGPTISTSFNFAGGGAGGGAAGPPGPSGPAGPSGTNGTNGTDGADGTPAIVARITGVSILGGNQWSYQVRDQTIGNTDGYGAWSDGATTRTAYNLTEELNSGSGTQGNGIDIDGTDFPAGFEMQPAPVGTYVLLYAVEQPDMSVAYYFQYENAVDGTCEA